MGNKLKKVFKYLWLLCFVQSFISCCREEDCETGYLNITTINFSQQESDTFILRRFKVNTNYNQFVDSLLLARDYNSNYTDNGLDTSFVILYETNPFRISTGYDYELFFPSTNTLRRISGISEIKNKQTVCLTKSGTRCFNDINSYKVDGMPGNNFNIQIYK